MLNKKHPQPNTLSQWRTGRGHRLYFSAVLMLTLCAALACRPWPPDTDPLTIVNNLSDFIFSCIKAVGVIVLGWGIVQLGMSIQSHDASQRTPGHPLRIRWFAHRFFQGDFVRYRRGVTCHAEVQQNSLLYQDTLWSMEDDRTDTKRANPCAVLLRLFPA